MIRRLLYGITALCALWAACGPDRPEGLYEPVARSDMSDANMGAGEMGGGPDMPTTVTGALTGTWLLVHSQSTCVLNREQMATTDYLVEITQEGSLLRERRRICAVNLTPLLGTSVAIPAATREAVTFEEVDRGFVSKVGVGGGYTSATELNLWGLALESPATDMLPREADDAKVVDADGDGNPGVTFLISDGECERYAAQRQIIRYHGSLTTPTQIDGGSVGLTEAVVFGATRSLCRIAPPIEPNDAHSLFRMVRVDGQGGGLNADEDGDGKISCAEVAALAPMVLERREADDRRCR
jgi:hypothetical protein